MRIVSTYNLFKIETHFNSLKIFEQPTVYMHLIHFEKWQPLYGNWAHQLIPYADDTVIISESAEGFQKHNNN